MQQSEAHAQANACFDYAEGLAIMISERTGKRTECERIVSRIRSACIVTAHTDNERVEEIALHIAQAQTVKLAAFDWQSVEDFKQREREAQTNTGGDGERIRHARTREVRDNAESGYRHAESAPAPLSDEFVALMERR